MEGRIPAPDVVRSIRDLAGTLDRVRLTGTATYDLMGEHLTKADVCEAICAWIDAGKRVERITTTSAPGHVGETAYVMKPDLNNKRFYVKVAIMDIGALRERLLIISAHVSM